MMIGDSSKETNRKKHKDVLDKSKEGKIRDLTQNLEKIRIKKNKRRREGVILQMDHLKIKAIKKILLRTIDL